jgi:hypothetical protein
MIPVTQSVLSTQYIQIQITAMASSGIYDPTGDVVQFAFTPVGFPSQQPVTWYAGSWETDPGPVYWAQCLIGPGSGGVVLAAGLWEVWVKVTDDPEIPVLQPAVLTLQ